MQPVREHLRRAERILEKSLHLYELLKQEHELEKKARARYRESLQIKSQEEKHKNDKNFCRQSRRKK